MLQDFDSNEQETKNLIKDVGGIVYMVRTLASCVELS
jgi:hypothetical protein